MAYVVMFLLHLFLQSDSSGVPFSSSRNLLRSHGCPRHHTVLPSCDNKSFDYVGGARSPDGATAGHHLAMLKLLSSRSSSVRGDVDGASDSSCGLTDLSHATDSGMESACGSPVENASSHGPWELLPVGRYLLN